MTGRILSRIALILGGSLLAFSFFLPLHYHAPFEEFIAAAQAVASSESIGEGAFPAGELVVVAYPYVWALVVVLAALWNFSGKRGAWPWLHVAINGLGCLALMALCIMQWMWDDPWLSAKLPGFVVVLPVLILLLVLGAALVASPERRAWVVIALGLLPQLLFQVMLVFISVEGAGKAEGFIIGSIGALLALAGAIGSARFQPRGMDAEVVASR